MPYWQDGRTINISRTGILFESEEKIHLDAMLEVQVNLSLNVTLSCIGFIVRAEDLVFAVRIHHCRIRNPAACNEFGI